MKTSSIIYSLAIFMLGFSQLNAQTVYIAETGKKYHVKSCPAVKTNSKALELSEAKKKGYDPCTSCGAEKIVEEKKAKKK